MSFKKSNLFFTTLIHFRGFIHIIGDNLRGKTVDEGRRALWKKNAAQKRQDQRDRRRKQYNPGRTQDEEDRERWRKHDQANKWGNPRRDPYEPNYGDPSYARNREYSPYRGNHWHALDYDPWDYDYDYDPIHKKHYP